MIDFVADNLHALREQAEAFLSSARDGQSIMARTYGPPGLSEEELVAYWEEQREVLKGLCRERNNTLAEREGQLSQTIIEG